MADVDIVAFFAIVALLEVAISLTRASPWVSFVIHLSQSVAAVWLVRSRLRKRAKDLWSLARRWETHDRRPTAVIQPTSSLEARATLNVEGTAVLGNFVLDQSRLG